MESIDHDLQQREAQGIKWIAEETADLDERIEQSLGDIQIAYEDLKRFCNEKNLLNSEVEDPRLLLLGMFLTNSGYLMNTEHIEEISKTKIKKAKDLML